MTPQQIVGLAVRLFSIWLVVIAFQMVGIVTALNQQFKGSSALALYVMPALPVLLAVGLWFFPMFVAHKLIPRSHDTNALRMPVREAAAAAAAIIGIWVVISSLPQIIAAASLVLVAGNSQISGMYFSSERVFSLLAVAMQLALGLFLLSKPWFVANKIFPSSKISGDLPE